jgi:hypothetical protein
MIFLFLGLLHRIISGEWVPLLVALIESIPIYVLGNEKFVYAA